MLLSQTSTRRNRPGSFVPQLETLEDRCVPARISPSLTPVIFVPGQPASLPRDLVNAANAQDVPAATAALNDFLTHLGTHPDNLTSLFNLDP
ncbi:MAG: hypothetical protein JNM56_25990 [Planctomycetia bacterium]|nr:hypothetical protein [Planctomycetia bacterium]